MIKNLLQEKKFFKMIVFATVLIIPIIYSFFYLKSYWDPYGNLKDVKVAMVNLDEGSRGEELIKNMQEAENTLGFTEVGYNEALEGLANDEYYAVITIPSDFSKSLESAKEEEKQKATITFTPNKRKNYLSYQIINSGLKTAEMQLQSKVAEEVSKGLAEKLEEIPDNLDSIIDGIAQVENGSENLSTGLSQLNDGTNLLSTKYSEFDNGLKSAKNGSEELSGGMSQATEGISALANGSGDLDSGVKQINEALDQVDLSNAEKLVDGIDSLDSGANALSNGIDAYIDGVHKYEQGIGAGVGSVKNGLENYQIVINGFLDNIINNSTDETLVAQATAMKNSPALAQMIGGLNGIQNADTTALDGGEIALKTAKGLLTGGTSQLKDATSKISELTDDVETLKSSLAEVEKGTEKLSNGLKQLESASNKIKDGSNTLSTGLDTLSSNSSIISDSLKQLSDGSEKAYDGSKKLTEGVNDLKVAVEEGKEKAEGELTKLNGIGEFVNDPVEFKEESFGEVESYGVAFTPLFLSIGLWVGALMLYVVLYYDQRHRFGIFDHEYKNKILQNLAYMGVGALQGLVTGLLLKMFLGFNVSGMGIYLLQCVWTGMLFTMIIQFLIRNMGDIGKFLALIILVLQLAASGGTFPVETIDKGFQGFTSWLPMTYTIRNFKDCLIPTDASLMHQNTMVVLGLFTVLLVLNIVIEFIKNKTKSTNIAESKN